jgi:hypothetical protein
VSLLLYTQLEFLSSSCTGVVLIIAFNLSYIAYRDDGQCPVMSLFNLNVSDSRRHFIARLCIVNQFQHAHIVIGRCSPSSSLSRSEICSSYFPRDDNDDNNNNRSTDGSHCPYFEYSNSPRLLSFVSSSSSRFEVIRVTV